MGKGFNNYMCKKFFHPASADNLKRVWIAQKKSEVEKKAQDDLRRQYDREQELYQNKALLSKESKERLELNFMYEPPPGVKKIGEKDGEDEDGKEPEYKFEWQRTWGHAPKESYLQKGDEFNEQPFGIQVCQAKCIKCGKYGHMNTDKRCALYGKSLDHDAPIQNVDQARLLNEMRADGLAMRYSTWDIDKEAGSSKAGGSHSLVEEERGVDRVEMLKNMSKEEKKKLLKKLKKMEKKDKKKSKKDKKKGRSKSESEEEEWEERGATVHHHHDKKSPKDEDKKSAKKNDTKRDEERNTERRRRDRSDSRDAARKERRRDRSDSREERKERRRDRSDSREDRRERRRDRSDSREGRRRERSRSSGGRKERRRS